MTIICIMDSQATLTVKDREERREAVTKEEMEKRALRKVAFKEKSRGKSP